MPPKAFGKYEVIRALGHGGMAAVYEARDPDLERRVAIKVIHAFLALDANLGERFRREARLVASLRHPHIVQLHDFGVAEDQPYMVMEYLEGGTLKDKLVERRAKKENWEPEEVFVALQDLASALDYAHARGAVHRDIKPGNILFTANGEVVLTDFGIAKLLNDLTQLSQTGGIIGTPVYMSPEQASGKPIDHRSDIYSLAIVVYEMLVGRPPFEGESPTTLLMKHVSEPPPPLASFRAGLAPDLEAMMSRALAKDPNQRFASAGEFALAFGEAISAAPPPQLGRRDALDAPTIIEAPTGEGVTVPAVRPGPARPGGLPGLKKYGLPGKGNPALTAAAPAEATRVAGTQAGPEETAWQAERQVPETAVAARGAAAGLAGAVSAPDRGAAGARPAGQRAGLRRWLAPAVLVAVLAIGAIIADLVWLRPVESQTAVESSMRLAFGDSAGKGRLDQITLTGTGLTAPAEGREYVAWLLGGGDARRRELGPLQLSSSNGVQFTYRDPNGGNLIAAFDGVEITDELAGRAQHGLPGNRVVASGSLPPGALAHVRHLLVPGSDPPEGGGFVLGLVSETQTLARLGQLLQNAADTGDVKGMTTVAEGIANLIAGPGGPNFGDANGDGILNDRSDGRGLLAAGDRPGYTDAVINHAHLAADSDDASENIKVHAEHVQIAATNVHDWAVQLQGLALDIAHARDTKSVADKVRDAVGLTNRMLNGQDTNGNEIVEPIPGEGGALTAYDHTLLMSQIELSVR